MKSKVVVLLAMICISLQVHGQKARMKYVPGIDTLIAPTASYAQYPYYIRIQLNAQTIDLFSNNGTNYQGILISQITKYRSVKKDFRRSTKPAFVYYKKFRLDTNISTQIAQHLIESGQNTVPTDSLIKSWNNAWPDCNIIWFKFRLNSEYNSQRFICLSSQSDTLQYKKIIVSNLAYLYKALALDSIYSRLETSVPKGAAYSRDAFTFTYFLTRHQIRKWDKLAPHMAYMKSVKDTLNNYLSDTLTKILAAKEFKCYGPFLLRFSKHGELLKISSIRFYKRDKEEENEYKQCRRLIFDAFNLVNIDFIKPHRGYLKELVYENGKVMINQ